jgi:hypothetical protein
VAPTTTDYVIGVTTPADYTPSPGNTGTRTVTAPLTSNTTYGPFEFGYFQAGTVTGAVRFDRDGDNDLFADNEPGMQGVTVTLLVGRQRRGGNRDHRRDRRLHLHECDAEYQLHGAGDQPRYAELRARHASGRRQRYGDDRRRQHVCRDGAVHRHLRRSHQQDGGGARTRHGDRAGVGRPQRQRASATTGENVGALPEVTVNLTVTVNLPGLLSTTITTSTVTSGGFYTFTALPGCVTGTNQVSFTLGFATPSGWFDTPSDVGPQPANNDSDGIGTGVDQLNDQGLQVGLTQTRDRGYYRPAVIQVRVFEETMPPINNVYACWRCADRRSDGDPDTERDA